MCIRDSYKGYIGHGGCTIKLNEGNGNALAAALEDEGRSVIMLAGEVLRVGEFKSGNTKIELRVHSETDPDVDGAECESTADDAASVLNFRGSDISEDTGGAQLYRWDHGYEWTIEFVGFVGPRPLLDARESDLWAGTAPTLRAQRVRPGQAPLRGTFRLGFEGHTTAPLSCEATAAEVEAALEGLTTISNVDVVRTVNNNGYNYEVKFWHPRGDVPPIYPLDDMLTGPDAAARVATFEQGTTPADYGSEVVAGAAIKHTIAGLDSGTGYFVRVAAITDEGRGAYTGPGIDGSGDGSEAWYGESIAEAGMLGQEGPIITGAIAPVEAPSVPRTAELYALEPTALRVAWAPPASDGGQAVVRYLVQWDVSEDFRNIKTSGYEASVAATPGAETCLLYTSPSPRDQRGSRMPSSA